MKTYNYIYLDKERNWNQVEINAISKKESWSQFLSSPIEFTYVNIL